MTDKVQKIREEVERLINNHDSALDYEAALEDVRNFIDSLQEEPVSEDLEEAAIMHYKDVIADAMIGLPYENKEGGYTHLIDVSRPLPVGNNKIAIIQKEATEKVLRVCQPKLF